MKAIIESYLQRIDLYFKDKSEKDTYMTYIMLFAVIFAFAYLLFWDSSEAEYIAKKAQVKSLESKINQDKRYLQQNPISKIVAIENQTKNAKVQTKSYKESNDYIELKIEEISVLKYDEKKWGEYLYSVSKSAKVNNIKILNFNNTLNKNSSSFGHVLDINIQAKGNYKNTLNFINSLEQSDLVIDLHDLNITANKTLYSDLNISVWGITY